MRACSCRARIHHCFPPNCYFIQDTQRHLDQLRELSVVSGEQAVPHAGYMASGLRSTRPFSPKPLFTSKLTSQGHSERLTTLRRLASTKAKPLGYKPAPPSSNKSPNTPPTGFAAIGSYSTIARRYGLSECGPSCTDGFKVDCYNGRHSHDSGDKLRIVSTMYEFDGPHLYVLQANAASGPWRRTEASHGSNRGAP